MSIGMPCQLTGHHINDNAREDAREDAAMEEDAPREEAITREEAIIREEATAREDFPLQSPYRITPILYVLYMCIS